MTEIFVALFNEEDGQGMTEYGLVLGGISILVFVMLVALSVEMEEMYEQAISILKSRHGN